MKRKMSESEVDVMNKSALYWDNKLSQYTTEKKEDEEASRYAEVVRGEDGFIAETWHTEPDGLAVRIMFSEEHYADQQYRETIRRNMEKRNSCTLRYLQYIKLPASMYDETAAHLAG